METLNLIRFYWNQQTTSEKVWGIGAITFFPILMLAIAVVLP